MKLRKWRCIGALVTVTALTTFVTTSFANAPNIAEVRSASTMQFEIGQVPVCVITTTSDIAIQSIADNVDVTCVEVQATALVQANEACITAPDEGAQYAFILPQAIVNSVTDATLDSGIKNVISAVAENTTCAVVSLVVPGLNGGDVILHNMAAFAAAGPSCATG